MCFVKFQALELDRHASCFCDRQTQSRQLPRWCYFVDRSKLLVGSAISDRAMALTGARKSIHITTHSLRRCNGVSKEAVKTYRVFVPRYKIKYVIIESFGNCPTPFLIKCVCCANLGEAKKLVIASLDLVCN